MGTDKALLKLGARTFIERIAGEATNTFDHVMLIADQHSEYGFLRLPSFPDIISGCGPLGGIHAALVHASTPKVFIVSCDLPLVTSEMMQDLVRLAEGDSIAIATDGTYHHPLFGIYPTTLAGAVESSLRAGERRVEKFLQTQKVRVIDFTRYRQRLRNINMPQEYRALLNDAASW